MADQFHQGLIGIKLMHFHVPELLLYEIAIGLNEEVVKKLVVSKKVF